MIPHNRYDINESSQADVDMSYFDKIKEANPDIFSTPLGKLMSKYYNHSTFKQVRNWSNTLKHSKILKIKDLNNCEPVRVASEDGTLVGYNWGGFLHSMVLGKMGKIAFERELKEDIIEVGIENITNTLIKYNAFFVDLVKNYDDFMNLDKFFEIKNGVRTMPCD